ncbi:MAG: hypothetical protein ABI208_06035 [Ginsengibacter sp.]
MKIEQFLIHYLLKNKELSLQGFGTFNLDGIIPEITDPSKPIIIPDGAISFTSNPKAETEPSLIEFIIENTGKIKPLAISDLDSYLNVCRQFLNIGNPFLIENIGTLQKLPNGELTYKSGLHFADKLNPQKKIVNDESYKYEDDMFKSYEKLPKKNNARNILMIIFILVFVLISWAVWHFIFTEKNDNSEIVQPSELIVPVPNSSVIKKDSTNSISSPNDIHSNTLGSYTFKIVVNKYTDLNKAKDRLQYLSTFRKNMILYSNDSIIYKIAETSIRPLSDTTKVLDSLKWYYKNEKLELEY